MSPIPQTVSWLGLFFAVSYSKPALEVGENLNKLLESNKIKTKTKLRQRNEKREKNFHLIATQWVVIYFEGVFLFLHPFL